MNSQIGYQFAVIDQYTGEKKTNTAVFVEISIIDNEGNSVFNGSYQTTTNDFGVASLQIGDDNMFDKMNWDNLPLFISALIDGNIELPTTQILSVPVAEYAKRSGDTNSLTIDMLVGKTWKHSDKTLIFNDDYTCVVENSVYNSKYIYDVVLNGYMIGLFSREYEDPEIGMYNPKTGGIALGDVDYKLKN